jgi:hypothetical protein
MEDYGEILRIVSNMVRVMEQSPRAFVDMQEEDLRTHFLVQLNGQFAGGATGETFNFDGKTDILVKDRGGNVFIAECKIWRGAEELKSAIDQILGYVTWRDTKAALIIFNRNKNFSAVVGQLPTIVKTHPSYVRSLPYASESGCRVTLRHRDDPQREIMLTIMAFEVPQ